MPARDRRERVRIRKLRRSRITLIDLKYGSASTTTTISNTQIGANYGNDDNMAMDVDFDNDSEYEDCDIVMDIKYALEDNTIDRDADVYFSNETTNDIPRRSIPTKKDWSSLLMIYKARRRQNNVDMNHLCKLLHLSHPSSNENIPVSWNSIKSSISGLNVSLIIENLL
ncbi:unnamed protein product [Didymodactylos carnosus]|uniref:Uncharacterized protein n=1 Tax=Didymodactylos carnosus TaxID=1234261 RepID=A0A8S2E6I2_9BILA|nr:unnamed protein product [Didymodactylos carnosus]CAF3930555.1 unnamed protein product [Didymodactylos carnosus]